MIWSMSLVQHVITNGELLAANRHLLVLSYADLYE